MVDIAQLVEHLIVVQKVACSSHVIHPTEAPRRKPRGFLVSIGRFRGPYAPEGYFGVSLSRAEVS